MPSSQDEATWGDLVYAAQAGDRDALERVLRSGMTIVNAEVRRRVPEASIEDVAQNVCLAVWEALPRLDAPGAFTAWLRRIMLREIADHYRVGETALVTEPLGDSMRGDETILDDLESWDVVREALAGLPEHYQVVLVLRGIEALPFSEVGAEIGLTAQGAESLFRRAKFKIRCRPTDLDALSPT